MFEPRCFANSGCPNGNYYLHNCRDTGTSLRVLILIDKKRRHLFRVRNLMLTQPGQTASLKALTTDCTGTLIAKEDTISILRCGSKWETWPPQSSSSKILGHTSWVSSDLVLTCKARYAAKRVLEVADNQHLPDTSKGQKELNILIPTTRVEKVDDEPSHGDVPGTAAHSMRTQDAVPDEIEIIPEGSRSRSASNLSSRNASRDASREGTPIPKTIVEKIDPQTPSHGEIPGTMAYALRQADAEPDVIVTAPETSRMDLEGTRSPCITSRERLTGSGSPTSARNRSPSHEIQSPKSIAVDLQAMVDRARGLARCLDEASEKHLVKSDDEEGFGDDFDDFEEGGGEQDFETFDDSSSPAATTWPSSSAKTYIMPHEHVSPHAPVSITPKIVIKKQGVT